MRKLTDHVFRDAWAVRAGEGACPRLTAVIDYRRHLFDAWRLPDTQMGFVSFRCDSAFRVQPFFDMHGAATTEQVTIRAPGITRRNFTTRIVGHNGTIPMRETTYATEQVIALPFAHYRSVTFMVHGGSEARAITARATARFVAGLFNPKGDPPLGACYVKHWLVSMAVSPY